MGWLIGLEPTAFWATHEGGARSEPERSDGNHPKSAGGARDSPMQGIDWTAERRAERRFFLLKVPLSEQKKSEIRSRAPP